MEIWLGCQFYPLLTSQGCLGPDGGTRHEKVSLVCVRANILVLLEQGLNGQ